MAVAASRPAPMARSTVAPPVTMSPPAHTPARRAAPARFVGLAELGADALQAADPAVLVAEEALREGEPVEDHALVARPLVVLRSRPLLLLGAAVDDVGLLGAEADRAAPRVHRGVDGAEEAHIVY